jgi:DNA polymerase-4
MSAAPRVIAHVDMDAFFASVELLRRPELREKPVVVGGSGPRAVVAAASYAARKFGIHSAQPMVVARRRCPELIIVPHDMELYRRVSAQVHSIFRRFTDTVESAGLDEAYLDLTGSPAPKARARQLKREIRAETALTCSVGLAPNKLLAKIASDLDKPDGLSLLPQEEMHARVGDRPASLIPGVGPKAVERLTRMGVRTVRELAEADVSELERAFGPRRAAELRSRAWGHDASPVTNERIRKSESRETTFDQDISDDAELAERVRGLAASVAESLAGHGRVGRVVTLKIRLAPFRTFTRSRTLPHPTADRELITSTAVELLERFERDAPVRLLGVGVGALDEDGPRPQTEDTAREKPAQLTLS